MPMVLTRPDHHPRDPIPDPPSPTARQRIHPLSSHLGV